MDGLLKLVRETFGGTRGKSIELAHRIGRYIKGSWDGFAQDDLILFVLVMALMVMAREPRIDVSKIDPLAISPWLDRPTQ